MGKRKSSSDSSGTTVTVTIYRESGAVETIQGVDESRAYYYERLPFTDSDVQTVSVRY